jgi:hypothetical protein
MHVREALDRLDAIHDHLARVELYHGFRAAAVAVVGVIGLLAAIAQPLLAGAPDDFVTYWVAVAGFCAIIGFGPAVYSYVAIETDLARRRTRLVFGQFLPCVVAGAVVTAAFVRIDPSSFPVLPGVWAILFGLGLISVRPYLPRAVGWVGLFYLAAGCILLVWEADHAAPSRWAVGGVFGPGHLATALALALGKREEVDD